jgi:23S rRNA (uracil1939-C5)-methyltransferase
VLLEVGHLVYGGSGLAHLPDGRVAFVALAAPGELVEATIEREHSDYVEAVATKVVRPSVDRVQPRCPYLGGGSGIDSKCHISLDRGSRSRLP